MKKIVFDATPLSEPRMSGIGHMTLELIKALERHPSNRTTFEIILVTTFDKRGIVKSKGNEKVRIKTVPIPMRVFNILWKFDLIRWIDLYVGKGSYIFTNYRNWPLASSSTYTFVCDMGYLLHPQYVSEKNRHFLEKNITKWVSRSRKIFAISKNAKQEIESTLKIREENISLVPCGVDRSIFYKRTDAEIAEFRKKYNLQKKFILFLGNIEPRKNIEGLINAYKILPKRQREEYSLLIIGGLGWLNDSTLDLIKKSQKEGFDIVHPKKYFPDEVLPILHSAAEVLVHPAHYEGFGISPLQAMSCGTPVVVSDNSSLKEIASGAALFVNSQNVQDISDKINEVLASQSLRDRLIKKGLARSKLYSWDKSAEILLKNI